MAERLVRDLAIEEALQIGKKLHYHTTINHMCDGVLYQMRKEIKIW